MLIDGRKKDFSKIVEDHNYFSDAQEDSVCKVTRAMDALEEQHYILTTFGEEKSERTIRIRGCSARSIKK